LLDEVTEMPLGLQAKLLRVLQEREVERVGGKKPIALDIRIVATSNRDMAEAVAKGILREDVYYRLNVFPLLIPALRQRPADIVPLAKHFLSEHGGRSGRPGLQLAPAVETVLTGYGWPGNVRELENVMQRAVIFAAGDTVEVEALHLSASSVSAPKLGVLLEPPTALPEAMRPDNMRDLEREHILETLAALGGSRKLAGERLGMSERTLRHKLKQYREAGLFNE
jgi:two-component system, response regulator FlrC